MYVLKTISSWTTIATLASIASVAQTTLSIKPIAQAAPTNAESIYQEYAAATDGKISFVVQTLDQGPLSQLAGKPFHTLLTVPSYRLESNQLGTQLQEPAFFVPNDPGYGQHDMGATADKFETIGLPLLLGTYRRLGITATIGGDSRFHESMEFCWPSLSQCKVVDPVVVFLQSKVNNRVRLAAEGWGLRIVYGSGTPGTLSMGPQGQLLTNPGGGGGVCGLASNHAKKDVSFSYPAHFIQLTDAFGIVLVAETLGAQKAGLSCDTSCHPQVFAESHSSSGSGTGGWNVDCDNTPPTALGTSGSLGKTWAETRCAHDWVQSASASVDIVKAGSASVDAKWVTLGRGVYRNGSWIADSCAYF
jgi:hypothetical protein